ncbi:MAG: 30S ribosomal protein S20 [Myxococcota bacterium]
MANHPSAAKRNRQNIKRNTRNTALRSRMRNAVRAARAAIESGADDRQALVDRAVQIVQRMASKNLIHKNTASRYVSRVVQANKKAS